MIDPLTSLAFSVYENKGVYALLLGSGVSRAAHIPTGWEITIDLVRRTALVEGVKEQADWANWHRRTFGKEPSYSELLDTLSQTPHERRSILHSYIEPNAEDREKGWKLPTMAHRAIANLVQEGFIRVIVTTNFDRLIESALKEVGIEPSVIASDDAIQGAVPLIHSACTIIKVHGDYLDTRIRNTEDELSSYTPALDKLLDRVLDEHGLIVCGWSADWDEALRGSIVRAPNRRYPLYWATRGVSGKFADGIIEHRAGRRIDITSADSFFDSLGQKILTLGEIHRPDPRSLQLLTASTKRFLAKPEYRIQLSELIGTEARRLAEFAANCGDPAGFVVEEFFRLVSHYESISEALARILGICGRWGSEVEFEEALGILKSLTAQETRGGFTLFIALRLYPAVLLSYALGLGALKAGRYDWVFEILSAKVSTAQNGDRYLVQELFLENWEGASTKWWAELPEFGSQRFKSALSMHLNNVLTDWTDDYLFDSKALDVLFDEFEMLASIAALQLSRTEADIDVMIADDTGQKWIWAPTGRSVWRAKNQKSIFAKWDSEEVKASVLAGGFAKGDGKLFGKLLLSVRKLIDRAQW
jgi:hypothetical protein